MSKTINHKVKVYEYVLARIKVNMDGKATIMDQATVQFDHAVSGREMTEFMKANGYQDGVVVSGESKTLLYEMPKDEFISRATLVISEEV